MVVGGVRCRPGFFPAMHFLNQNLKRKKYASY
jgi:hypothetical protein